MGMLVLALFSFRGAEAKEFTLPLTLDYPLLMALDALDPSLGIEISRDGLIRLARLLREEILNLYLRRYALKKIRLPEGEQYPLANDLLAPGRVRHVQCRARGSGSLLEAISTGFPNQSGQAS